MANDAKTFADLDKLHAGPGQRTDIVSPSVPIISIPTSPSGGEYSFSGGGTNDHTHQKYSFSKPTKGPALVILDPELTTTTPDRIWLSTGMRAVDHCVEGMCSLQSTTASDEDATKGLRLLVPGLLRCKRDRHDLDARIKCMYGVIEAMKPNYLHFVPMGASHGIGHQLGPLGVGHGETSCIMLPAVCKYNFSANAQQQEKVRAVLWSEPEVAALFDDKGLTRDAQLGDLLDVVIRALGLPRSLKEVNVGEDKLDMLAENSLRDRWLPTNPRPLTEKAQVIELLRAAVE
jgi:alcohol dehydrogenase class IV